MFNISEAAAKKIKSIIDEEDPSLKLRVFVQGGGCTGFQYGFSLEELPPADDDFLFEKDGIGVMHAIPRSPSCSGKIQWHRCQYG